MAEHTQRAAIYVLQRNTQWLDVIKDLACKLRPAAIIADDSVIDEYRKEFPRSFIIGTNGYTLDWSEDDGVEGDLVGPVQLSSCGTDTLVALKTFDRYFMPEELTLDERLDRYIHMRQMCNKIMRATRPDYIIYQNVPFHASHLSLYHESLRWDVKNVIGHNINFPFRGLLRFSSSLQGDLPNLHGRGKGVEGFELSDDDAKREVEALLENYNVKSGHLPEAPFYRREKGMYFHSMARKRWPRITEVLDKLFVPEGCYRAVFGAFLHIKCWIGRCVCWRRKSSACRKLQKWKAKKSLFKVYGTKISVPDYNSKYIYFSLHYQPERSTIPDGAIYGFQLYALRIVASAIPSDWKIYVKEHPGQFDYANKGENGRTGGFYQRIVEMPNCHLVGSEIPAVRLIDNSQLVASVNGTVSVEAAIRGKKAIVFGRPPFLGMPSVFRVTDTADVLDVISRPDPSIDATLPEIRKFFEELYRGSGRALSPRESVEAALEVL